MHRVELKEEVESKINSWFFKFLMHRVELKVFSTYFGLIGCSHVGS